MLGAVPFLSLALGGLVWRFAKFSGPLTVVIMVLSIVLPAVRSIELADNLVPDTRRQAREWLVANLPPETKILIEASYSPRLRETNFQVRLAKLANHPERFTVTELGQVPEDYLLVNSFSYQRYFSEPKANPLLKKRWSRMFESFPLVAEFQSPEGRYGFHNPTIRLYRVGTEWIEIDEQVQSNAPLPDLDKTGDGSIQEGPTEEQLGSE